MFNRICEKRARPIVDPADSRDCFRNFRTVRFIGFLSSDEYEYKTLSFIAFFAQTRPLFGRFFFGRGGGALTWNRPLIIRGVRARAFNKNVD